MCCLHRRPRRLVWPQGFKLYNRAAPLTGYIIAPRAVTATLLAGVLHMNTNLRTRQLGTSDLNITVVGFGAWAIGGGGWSYGWGPQDDNDSIAAMNHAADL